MGDAGAAPGRDAAPQGSNAAAAPAPAPAQSASPQPRVPHEGLSLAALRAFTEAHAGREYTLQTGAGPVTLPFAQLTTAQVVEAVVKPATANGGDGGGDCTYAELLLAQARARGGTSAMGLCLRHVCMLAAVMSARWPRMCVCASTPARVRPRRRTQGVCDARGRPHVGPATRFVSHAWKYPFADLLAALLARGDAAVAQHTTAAEDEYLWIGVCLALAPCLRARAWLTPVGVLHTAPQTSS
jgi:hypothetical protein